MKKFIKENSLSLILFLLFFVFLIGLSLSGWLNENEEMSMHNQQLISYSQYLVSSNFIEAVFENWESEFLQMGALVVLTIWLKQKGSADSKKIRGKNKVDTTSRYSILHSSNWSNRGKAVKEALYANSLSLILFILFFISLGLHAFSGAAAANEEARIHQEPQVGVSQYVMSSQFWFESFQNWQSEFLAVAALIVLSIYLRQRQSPESKPIGESNAKTGS